MQRLCKGAKTLVESIVSREVNMQFCTLHLPKQLLAKARYHYFPASRFIAFSTRALYYAPIMGKRILAIDYLKTFLVFGMILAHAIQLLGPYKHSSVNNYIFYFTTYINLVSFSGFLFCFGFVYYIAYFTKDFQLVKNKMLTHAFKIIISYYISALIFQLFYSGINLTSNQFLDILFFFDIPGFSEFLLSFFIITLISLLFFPFFKRIINGKIISALFGLSLLSPILIPYESIKNNHIGLLIGTHNFTGFPILPYFVYFLSGIYLAKQQIRFSKWLFLLSIIATGSFVGYGLLDHTLPKRFPPSIYWILGGAAFIYVYYLIALWIAKKHGSIKPLISIGNNSLFYLLLSNLILFISARKMGTLIGGNSILALLYGLTVFVVIYFLFKTIRHPETITASKLSDKNCKAYKGYMH